MGDVWDRWHHLKRKGINYYILHKRLKKVNCIKGYCESLRARKFLAFYTCTRMVILKSSSVHQAGEMSLSRRTRARAVCGGGGACVRASGVRHQSTALLLWAGASVTCPEAPCCDGDCVLHSAALKKDEHHARMGTRAHTQWWIIAS